VTCIVPQPARIAATPEPGRYRFMVFTAAIPRPFAGVADGLRDVLAANH
jgi:hypothetical protein